MRTSTCSSRIASVHSAVSGRVRFSVPEIYRSQILARKIEEELTLYDGIIQVRANPLTNTVLIVFKPKKAKINKLSLFLLQILDNAEALNSSQNGSISWHRNSASELVMELNTHLVKGLKRSSVRSNRRKYGINLDLREVPRTNLAIFKHQFQNLSARLLLGATVVSLVTGGFVDAIVVGIVLLMNGYIGFLIETNSEKIIHSVINSDYKKVPVIRNGKTVQIEPSSVVVGDLIKLRPGLIIPGDARVIKSEGLTLDESILTGESIPVHKTIDPLPSTELPIGDRKNMAFRGTAVTGGTGLALVVAVGVHSEVGRIQKIMKISSRPQTQLEKQLEHLGNQMAAMAIASSAIVLVLGLIKGQRFLDLLRNAISMSVAAIPESLPTVATTTLGRGLKNLKDRNIIVRYLGAIETLAAVDHFCFDKTGTLTLNQMEVMKVATAKKRFEMDSGTLTHSGRKVDPRKFQELGNLIKVAILCSEAKLSKSNFKHPNLQTRVSSGSPTESALLKMAVEMGGDYFHMRKEYPLISTQHRQENRPYMVTRHLSKNWGQYLAVKGAPEDVLGLCRYFNEGKKLIELTEWRRRKIADENLKLAKQGLRVLGFAHGNKKSKLSWLGLVGMADPVRKEVKGLVPQLHQAGIECSMITGDQAMTAKAIGQSVGIDLIFSRVSPGEKLEIIQNIQKDRKKIVAMVGDGINDGPALKSADVGVAMAARGSEVASQAADVVLPGDNIQGLLFAIQEGRIIHLDIKKAAEYAVAKNLSEIIFTLVSLLSWGGEPFTPIQFLWINLITDTFPELALARELPLADVLKEGPEQYRKNILSTQDLPRILFNAAVLSIVPAISYFLGLNRYHSIQRANSLAFLTMAGSSLLFTLSARSNEVPIFSYKSLHPNVYVSEAIGIGILTEFLGGFFRPLRSLLGLQAFNRFDVGVSLSGSVLPLVIVEGAKLLNLNSNRD